MLTLMLAGCIHVEVLQEAWYDDLHVKTWDGVACDRLDRYPEKLRSGMDTPELSGLIRCEYTVREKSTSQDVWKWRTEDHVLKVVVLNGRVNSWDLVEK
ncbi:MAG: hypothetical protein GY913_29975 [Proteobacteria bacterium]|nr:hypothetical protein [Pseudomonadota bacterium]MCP4921145.1 hypothetical protein [Pseudomonadota bacterium]